MTLVTLYKLAARGPNFIRHGTLQPGKIFVLLPINRVRSIFTYLFLRNWHEPELYIWYDMIWYDIYDMNANNTVLRSYRNTSNNLCLHAVPKLCVRVYILGRFIDMCVQRPVCVCVPCGTYLCYCRLR